MIKLTTLFLMSSMVLAGCGTVGVERVENIAAGTSISPISLMGNTLAINHVGTTIFSNNSVNVDAAEWKIVEQTEETAVRLINDGKKFQSKPIYGIQNRKKAQVHADDFSTSSPYRPQVNNKYDSEVIRELARESGADYVLVIMSGHFGDPFFGTNQRFSGYGIYQRSFLGSNRAVNYAMIAVGLFDGKTGEEVANTHGYLSSKRSEADWITADNMALTTSNEESTKTSIKKLIDDLLRKLLEKLKITSIP
jgi:hypothetical protein